MNTQARSSLPQHSTPASAGALSEDDDDESSLTPQQLTAKWDAQKQKTGQETIVAMHARNTFLLHKPGQNPNVV